MKQLLLLLAIFCFAACSTDGTDSPDNPAPKPKDPIVIPDQPDLKPFTEQGGSATYRFTAKADWTADVAATRAVEWCRVSPTSGGQGEVTLSISADPNDTADERNATIKLQAGSFSKAFSISQKQQNALTVTSSKIEIEAAGGTATVEVKANISFEYEIGADCKEWVTYSGTRAMETSRLEFKVAANDDTALREGTITIRSSEGSETVKIYQSGAASVLVLTQKDYTVAAEGATIKVEIKSNVDYDVTMPTANWITEVGTRAMSTHTRYYAIAPNEEYDARSAEIVFTNKANNLTQKVTVSQVQKDALVVAQNSYTVTNAGGEIKIAVNHNVDFDVAIGADWVTQVGTRALTTDNLTFKVAAHTSYDNREAKITFTSKDKAITQEVKVYQAQKNAIIVSKREYTLDETAGQIEIEVRANIEFTVEDPGVDWLHKIETRALTTHTLRYTVDANTDYDPRTATIKITNKDNNISETVTITQMQKDAIVVAKSEYELGREGGVLDFDVMTNVSLTVAISTEAQSWITTQEKTRGLEQKTLHFDIAACSQNDDRTGTITISGGSVTQTIKVTQSGIKEMLERERAALIAFYNATNGDNWKNNTNWCSDKPVWEWYGVRRASNNSVIYLILNNNQLTGTIPPEIGDLKSLRILQFYNNQLTGSIPAEIWNLTDLFQLGFPNNQLTGSIPAEIGNLAKLTTLHLTSNRFEGPIPPEIGKLTNLTKLNLFGNQLTGSIPPEIGDLKALTDLELGGNQLTGSIPLEICNLPNLSYLDLRWSELSGSIPPEIGNLEQLEALILDGCELTGTIPAEMGNLHNLMWLGLYKNKMTGVIPESIIRTKFWQYSWTNILFQHGEGFDRNSIIIPGPEFSVTTYDGKHLNSSVYTQNKYTILLETGDDALSDAYISELRVLYNGYRKKGVEVVGYTYLSNVEIQAFATRNKITWPMFHYDYNLIGGIQMPGLGSLAVHVVDEHGMIVFNNMFSPRSELGQFFYDNLGAPEEPEKPYESTDYSQDGTVTTLQRATEGNGINIVLMGDAYSDRLIADGTYAATMRKAMDYFFTEEPYKSFRDCFNVYSVNVVSKNEKYGPEMQTALSGYFGEGTRVGGNDNKCIEYATRVPGISDSNLGSTLVVVMMNRKYYAGTCYMYYPNSGDYSQGVSISYFPFLDDEDFKQVLHHEAGGHGFPKLADEYAYQNMGAIPQSEIDGTKQLEPYGWWKNVDFTSDVTRIKWSKFIADPRYAAEALGAYQGGLTFWSGVWRPTETSIMRYNVGGFNAPSREAIYYRIHKLAYGASWTYNYEDFVRYDAVNRTGDVPRMLRAPMAEPKNFVPLHPPVVIRK